MPEQTVRPPICADDRWMPRRETELRELLDQLLANASAPTNEGELIGLIAPHAGYAFSGQTAAYSYKQLEGRDFTRAVVIGPSHFADLGAQAVNTSDFYETPFGRIELDAGAVDELNHRVGINFVPRDREHSLEMQLPFLQRMLGTFKLVPILMSHPFYLLGLRARNECEDL